MATFDKSSKQIVIAVVRFAIIFGLLIFPWPGWNDVYGGYFRALGQAAFSRQDDRRVVLFQPYSLQHNFSSVDSQMILGNRDLAIGGKGRAEKIGLDTRSIGWMPTALTLALILATPVPWRQRGWALLWGFLLIQAFILFSLQAWIWDISRIIPHELISILAKNYGRNGIRAAHANGGQFFRTSPDLDSGHDSP